MVLPEYFPGRYHFKLHSLVQILSFPTPTQTKMWRDLRATLTYVDFEFHRKLGCEKAGGGCHDQIVNGQEMAEGTDRSGSVLGMEQGGGGTGSRSEVKEGNAGRKHKKVGQRGRSSVSKETDNEQARGCEEKHMVIIRLEQEGASYGEWNPVEYGKCERGGEHTSAYCMEGVKLIREQERCRECKHPTGSYMQKQLEGWGCSQLTVMIR